MTRVLVLFFEGSSRSRSLAQSVYAGTMKSRAEATLMSYDQFDSLGKQEFDSFDLFFLQADYTSPLRGRDPILQAHASEWKARNVALFGLCSSSQGSKKKFKELAAKFDSLGANVKNTIALYLKGPLSFLGNGRLEEIDFVRAEAFGERTTNYFTGHRVFQPSEKARIAGYKKPQ